MSRISLPGNGGAGSSAGGAGGGERFSLTGNAAVGVGGHRVYNDSGAPLTIRSVRASVKTAPAGSSLIADVNLDGVTIFTTQANRPTIPDGALTSGMAVPAVTVWPAGSFLTADVDQIGSTTPGAELVIQVDPE